MGETKFNLSDYAKTTAPITRLFQFQKCPDKTAQIEVVISCKYTEDILTQSPGDQFSDMQSNGSEDAYVEEEKKPIEQIDLAKKQNELSAMNQPKIMSSINMKKDSSTAVNLQPSLLSQNIILGNSTKINKESNSITTAASSQMKPSDIMKSAGSMVIKDSALEKEVLIEQCKKKIEERDKLIETLRSENNSLNSQIKVYQKEQVRETGQLNKRIEELKEQLKIAESEKDKESDQNAQFESIKKIVYF